MQVVLRQRFGLGRFHATPWKVNPFDDPFGEWPPSPWRLARAIVARSYQWGRETGQEMSADHLDQLIHALRDSRYRFHLPVHARRGGAIRQYQPVEFGWNPAEKKKAAVRSYRTSLAQDNYWCLPVNENIWWFIEGEAWNTNLLETMDQCLTRITYFGRAEALTEIRRTIDTPPEPNCQLLDRRSAGSVPVLVPAENATRADIERTTADALAARNVPQGARLMYAKLPRRPPAREMASPCAPRTHSRLIQFAIGWNVAVGMRSIVRLTARFRSRVLRQLYRIKTGGRSDAWNCLDEASKNAIADMLGKDATGRKLDGHRHAEFHVWCENEAPTRLVVFRESRPFDTDEQQAILQAAERELSWAGVPAPGAWTIRLVPLDQAVPPPPGYASRTHVWDSLTPYVPPRHHLRRGTTRGSESLERQVQRELALRGFANAERVQVEELREPAWVSVHVPASQRKGGRTLGDRRAYFLRLRFPDPVAGPIRLGQSSSFGLGFFSPAVIAPQ